MIRSLIIFISEIYPKIKRPKFRLLMKINDSSVNILRNSFPGRINYCIPENLREHILSKPIQKLFWKRQKIFLKKLGFFKLLFGILKWYIPRMGNPKTLRN